MRLRRVQVEHFRSIVDSSVVEIEERVTVLVGKNEQGKTTFLRALASLSPKVTYTQGDLPNHLRPALEERAPTDIPVVRVWLSLEPPDKVSFKDIVAGVDSFAEIKATRFFDGSRTYAGVATDGSETPLAFTSPNIDAPVDEIKKHAEALKAKFTAAVARLPTFAPALPQAESQVDQFMAAKFRTAEDIDNLIKVFSTGLASLPGQDAPIQEDISSAVKSIQGKQAEILQILQRDTLKLFEQHLPHFVFHSTSLDKIPNEVSIAEFVKSPETVSKGMANLCGVTGLSMQKIQELAASPDTPMKEGFEDHFRSKISGGLNEFWRQETYTVHFRFDKDKMSVSISDGTYQPRIAPIERSDGFQWYLSFYSALLNEVDRARPTVFLLDNPGLELHADGQADIKRFLEEKLPPNTQVIYVTHSPAMIDPYNLDQVRQVELRGDMQGTKVTRLAFKDGKEFDLLEPVRSALGASLASSLIFNELNILVEGAADKPILEGSIQRFHGDEKNKILVNGSVAETKDGFLVRFYQRAKLPFVVLLDADSRGRELAKSLQGWGVPAEKILEMASLFDDRKGQDFDIEDIVSAAFYHQAVQLVYPDAPVEPPAEAAGKRTKEYEKLYREKYAIGFNKRRVAEMLKKLVVEEKADEASTSALQKISSALLAALKKQIPGQ